MSSIASQLASLNTLDAPPARSTSSSTTSSNSALGNYNLKPSDFINLMVTELQNQDPTKPASSQDLLTQMSQIGSLQSSTSLQDTLTSFGLQSSISSAGNLIGKSVQGLDDKGKPAAGIVTSVKVVSNKAYLQLDNGKELQVANVTAISPATAAAAATGTAATPTGTPAPTPAAG